MAEVKIVERLKKLLALSKSSNQHEAELALAKFNELLTTHQLQMSDIDVREEGAVKEEKVGMGRKGSKALWMISLATSCAKLNDCEIVVGNNPPAYSIIYFGRVNDIAVSKALFEHLQETWKGIFAEYLRESGYSATKRIRNSHAMGFTGAIRNSVRILIEERKQALRQKSTTGTAIVLIKGQEVQNYIKDNYTDLRTIKSRRRTVEGDALAAGRVAGNAVPLGGAVGRQKLID